MCADLWMGKVNFNFFLLKKKKLDIQRNLWWLCRIIDLHDVSLCDQIVMDWLIDWFWIKLKFKKTINCQWQRQRRRRQTNSNDGKLIQNIPRYFYSVLNKNSLVFFVVVESDDDNGWMVVVVVVVVDIFIKWCFVVCNI